MTRLREIAPRDRLDAVLLAAQDAGRMHVVPPSGHSGLMLPLPEAREQRRRRQVERRLADADDALRLLAIPPATPPLTRPPLAAALQAAARGARTARALARRESALRDEQAMLRRYRAVLDAVLPVLQRTDATRAHTAHAVVLPDAAAATRVREALRGHFGTDLLVESRPLPEGAVALVLVLRATMQAAIETQLSASRLPEVPLNEGYRDGLRSALPRLAALPAPSPPRSESATTPLRRGALRCSPRAPRWPTGTPRPRRDASWGSPRMCSCLRAGCPPPSCRTSSRGSGGPSAPTAVRFATRQSAAAANLTNRVSAIPNLAAFTAMSASSVPMRKYLSRD
jgi:hypothetical protein